MNFSSEELYSALWQTGAASEGESPHPEIIARLAELKMVEVQPGGKPELTTLGWQLYSQMQLGDTPPEFEQQ